MSSLLEIRTVQRGNRHAHALEEEMQEHYVRLNGEPDQDPDNSMYLAEDTALLWAEMTEGYTEPAGVIAWSRWEDGAGKIRLLYVTDRFRGRRYGDLLLKYAETALWFEGVKVMKFETGDNQHSAIRLYERNGYERTDERFGFYRDNPTSVFYRKVLA